MPWQEREWRKSEAYRISLQAIGYTEELGVIQRRVESVFLMELRPNEHREMIDRALMLQVESRWKNSVRAAFRKKRSWIRKNIYTRSTR